MSTAEHHDYEPDRERPPTAMHTDRPCRVCGQSRRDCERLEQHRFTFEGATSLLARHLVEDHDVPPKDVAGLNGMTQGHWVALDDLHKQAHESTGAGE